MVRLGLFMAQALSSQWAVANDLILFDLNTNVSLILSH